eukprot:jgi/Ulvmu1/11544/UM078_0034.1
MSSHGGVWRTAAYKRTTRHHDLMQSDGSTHHRQGYQTGFRTRTVASRKVYMIGHTYASITIAMYFLHTIRTSLTRGMTMDKLLLVWCAYTEWHANPKWLKFPLPFAVCPPNAHSREAKKKALR